MNNNDKNNNGKTTISFDFGGVGLITFIVFLILKLTHVIDWEWIFVFLPIIIPCGFIALALIVIAIGFILVYIDDKNQNKPPKRK